MKPVVLFVDGTAPTPFDPDTLKVRGLGGTEASLIRVAEGLATTGLFSVYVEIHNKTDTTVGICGAVFCPPDTVSHADYVISLRHPPLLALMQKRFPNAKHYLWHHDLMQPSVADQMLSLRDYETIAVSNFHKTQMQVVLKPQGYDGQFPIKVIYNPIADDLQPDSTPVDRNKLVWTSSPHKGLDYALQIFENLLSFNPDFKLYVANPGYLPNSDTSKERNVVALGPLPHPEVVKHLRSALCLWYPNPVFPETFGLVLAEADAVGTPVIAHAFGAASEVLDHPYEYMDCRNPKTVIDRTMTWYNGDRPRVKANPKFRLSEVIKSWTKLFR